MVKKNTALKNLIDLTDRKIKHLKDILDITYKQKYAITNRDIDLLTQYIDEKQKHIDAVSGLDEEFENIYDGVKAEFQGNDLQRGKAISDEEAVLYGDLKIKVKEAQDMIKTIYGIEKENNESAKQFMEELKEKIRGISVAKKGYKAYKSSPTMTDGVFIDKKR